MGAKGRSTSTRARAPGAQIWTQLAKLESRIAKYFTLNKRPRFLALTLSRSGAAAASSSSVSDNLAVDVVNLNEIRLGPCASLASL
jgi:hypothetical protein